MLDVADPPAPQKYYLTAAPRPFARAADDSGHDVSAAVREVEDLLEDALAERGDADDRRPVAVLQRAGDDLRRRRGAAVDEHHDRDLRGDGAAAVAGRASGSWWSVSDGGTSDF